MKEFVLVSLVAAGAVSGATVSLHRASSTTRVIVHVTLMDYMIMPAQRHLPVGRPITLIIANRGHHTHEFVLERANAFDQAIRFHGASYEADDIKPGTTRQVTWTIPQTGTYKLACHIDHHYQKGMRKLITADHAST